MARLMKPLVRGGGYYPSNRWTPLVYPGGYTTANGGWQPEPEPVLKTVTGSFIHITDALALPAEALTVNVEPIQDLRGYDNPWPAGGGKNLLENTGVSKTENGITWTVNNDSSISARGTASGNSLFVVNQFTFDGQSYILTGCPEGGASTTKWQIQVLEDLTSGAVAVDTGSGVTISRTGNLYIRCVVRSGNTVDLVFKPMIRLASVTDATFAPYSNICPITGWDSVTVNRTGKNLLDMGEMVDAVGNPVGTLNDDGSLTVTTNAVISVQQLLTGELNAGTYTVTNVTENISAYVQIGSNSDYTHVARRGGGTRTFDYDGTSYLRILFTNQSANSTEIYKAQLELGSTATAYEPFQGSTYSITFPTEAGTVYGGQLDVTQGKLTVDRAIVDLGTLTWNLSNGNFYAYMPTNAKAPVANGQDALCENYPVYVGNYNTFITLDKLMQVCNSSFSAKNKFVLVRDSAFSDAATFKTAMSGVLLVYELATPFELTLTPEQITTLQGTNNVWSDGEMTLVYLADGNASDVEALNILLGGRYVNNHGEDEPSDREALDIVLGGKK